MSQSIDGGGIYPVDAKFKRPLNDSDGFFIVLGTPAKFVVASAYRPCSQPKWRYLHISIAKLSSAHSVSFLYLTLFCILILHDFVTLNCFKLCVCQRPKEGSSSSHRKMLRKRNRRGDMQVYFAFRLARRAHSIHQRRMEPGPLWRRRPSAWPKRTARYWTGNVCSCANQISSKE